MALRLNCNRTKSESINKRAIKIIASDYFNNQSEDFSDSYFTIEEEQGGGNQGDTTLVFFSESSILNINFCLYKFSNFV